MDYIEWAEQYETNAEKVQEAIERKANRRHKGLTADQRQRLNAEIAELRHIYREMLSIAQTLRERGNK